MTSNDALEGGLYEVPDSDGLSLGSVLVLATNNEGVCLGLLFDQVETMKFLSGASAKHQLRCLFGDLHIIDGKWKLLNQMNDTSPYLDQDTFEFKRENMFGQCFKIRFGSSLRVLSEIEIEPEQCGLPDSAVFGATALADHLREASKPIERQQLH